MKGYKTGPYGIVEDDGRLEMGKYLPMTTLLVSDSQAAVTKFNSQNIPNTLAVYIPAEFVEKLFDEDQVGLMLAQSSPDTDSYVAATRCTTRVERIDVLHAIDRSHSSSSKGSSLTFHVKKHRQPGEHRNGKRNPGHHGAVR